MQLSQSVVPLFDYRIDDLAAALPPAESPLWDKALFRQKTYDVHRTTRSIIFAWLNNDWNPAQPPIVFEADWGQPALAAAVKDCVGELLMHRPGRVVKLVLAELPPGTVIPAHKDAGAALRLVHRCHVPIVSNEQVEFAIDGVPHYLAPGRVYEIDNTRRHAVANRGECRRVHMICDILPDAAVAAAQ